MKIINYKEFVKMNENVHDTPEEYIKIALMKIKTKLEKMFDNGEGGGEGEVQKFGTQKEKGGSSLADFNVELQSCELSRYSKVQDSIKIKYSDAESMYDLMISIDLKQGVPEDPEEEFSDKDIKKCHIKFKKYDLRDTQDDFKLIGEITKNIDIADIDEDFLVSLKIEMDEEFGEDENELEIEIE